MVDCIVDSGSYRDNTWFTGAGGQSCGFPGQYNFDLGSILAPRMDEAVNNPAHMPK